MVQSSSAHSNCSRVSASCKSVSADLERIRAQGGWRGYEKHLREFRRPRRRSMTSTSGSATGSRASSTTPSRYAPAGRCDICDKVDDNQQYGNGRFLTTTTPAGDREASRLPGLQPDPGPSRAGPRHEIWLRAATAYLLRPACEQAAMRALQLTSDRTLTTRPARGWGSGGRGPTSEGWGGPVGCAGAALCGHHEGRRTRINFPHT